MDESLQELENELKALRPRRPSALLRARIERDLAAKAKTPAAPRYTSATTLRSWKWFSWQSASAVAAGVMLALSVAVWHGRTTARDDGTKVGPAIAESAHTSTAPAYVPVSAASVLYDMQDEGTVELEGEQAARQARFRYVDTYTWKNPATNASLKFSVPRDEVRVLPANYH